MSANAYKEFIMQDVHISKMPLRALKIIRKGYRNGRSDPETREKLRQINELIDAKERRFSVPKNVVLANPPEKGK